MAEVPQKKARVVRPMNPFVVAEQQLRLSAQAQLEDVVNDTESLDAMISAVQMIVENMPPCKVRGESIHLLNSWHQRRRELAVAGNSATRPISKIDVIHTMFKQVQALHPELRLDATRPPSPQTCLSIAGRPGITASEADLFRNLHLYLGEYAPELIGSASSSSSSNSGAMIDTSMVLGLRAVPVKTTTTNIPTTDSSHTQSAVSSSSSNRIEIITDKSSSSMEKKKNDGVVRRNLNPVFRSTQRDEAVNRRIEEFGSEVIKRVKAILPLQVTFRRPLKPDESPDGLVVSATLSNEVEFQFTHFATKEACSFREFRERAMTRTVASRDHLTFTDQPSLLYARKSPSDPWRRLHTFVPVSVTHFLDDMSLRQFVARDTSIESSPSSPLDTV